LPQKQAAEHANQHECAGNRTHLTLDAPDLAASGDGEACPIPGDHSAVEDVKAWDVRAAQVRFGLSSPGTRPADQDDRFADAVELFAML